MEKHGALRYGSTKVRRNFEDPDELCFVCLFVFVHGVLQGLLL